MKTITISDKLHAEFKVAAAIRKVKLGDAADFAIRAWITSKDYNGNPVYEDWLNEKDILGGESQND